jgi:hypothetical protein
LRGRATAVRLKNLILSLWQDYIERMSMTWTSGSFPAACKRLCRGGEEESQAGWAQHKKAILPLMCVVNALGNPVLAVRDRDYEAQRVNALYIFRANLFVMPFEEFRTSAYAAAQCTGEENCAFRCLDSTTGNNFIFCFFLGHFNILSYCKFRGRENMGYAHACQSAFLCCVL